MKNRTFLLGFFFLLVSSFMFGQKNEAVRFNNFCEVSLKSDKGDRLSQFNESGEFVFTFHHESFPDIGKVQIYDNGFKTILDYQIIKVEENLTVYQLGDDGMEGLLFVTDTKITRTRSQNNSVLTEVFYWWD